MLFFFQTFRRVVWIDMVSERFLEKGVPYNWILKTTFDNDSWGSAQAL